MDSLTPINFQAHAGRVAQAYGARPPARADLANAGSKVAKASVGPDGVVRPPFAPTGNPSGDARGAAESRQDRLTLSGRAAPLPQPIDQLVAGQVDSPVSRGEGFDEPGPAAAALAGGQRPAPARTSPATGAFAMYARSADKVEVATSVALGRSLDIRG